MKKESKFNQILQRLKKHSELIFTTILVVVFSIFLLCGGLLLYTVFQVSSDCSYEELICYLLGANEKQSVVELLGNALKILGFGSLALLGVWVANRRASAMEKTAQAQAESAKAQARATAETEKGNRQQRFRDAVEHLGHKSSSVRQGGAHELFHLALEEEDFRQSIAEILCTHIVGTTRSKEYNEDEEHKDQPSTEIQSLMSLLFEGRDAVKRKTLKRFWKGINPDLSGGYFRGLKLKEAQFQRVNFTDAQLQKADLQQSQFQCANLTGAQLQRANLEQSQFQNANFEWTQLQKAILVRSQFQDANFMITGFQGACLSDAQFQGANFCEPQFQNSSLWNARFQGASFIRGQFQKASLSEAQFQGVAFRQTEFQAAFLSEANFRGAFFGEAPLKMGSESMKFQERIKSRINCPSDLRHIVFSGGVKREFVNRSVDKLKENMPEGSKLEKFSIAAFQSALKQHIEAPESDDPPEDIETGSYNENDAEKWIAEYEKAMNWDQED